MRKPFLLLYEIIYTYLEWHMMLGVGSESEKKEKEKERVVEVFLLS